MSLSAGLSNSQSATAGGKTSIGPVAFGSVQISQAAPPAAKTSAWLWPALAAAAAAVAFFLFRRK